ncbi:hypothetical protein HN011_009154 [Eciton burchellii]|nr:hypothetical protein HN011_009154 [Eciton burchellii]
MLNDPADKTHRKPRQLRNTPLLKYVNLISLGVTLIYAGACYISYKKNVVPFLNDEECKKMIKEMQRRDSIIEPSTFINSLMWEETYIESDDQKLTDQN